MRKSRESTRLTSADDEVTTNLALLPVEEATEDTICVAASQIQPSDGGQVASEPSGLHTQNDSKVSKSEYIPDSPSPSIELALQDADQAMEYLEQREIAVVVPPVERRWKYETYHEVPIIDKVIKERKNTAELQYLVKFHGGEKLWITFEHLRQLPGGSSALIHFNQLSSSHSQTSDSYSSGTAMVSARSIRSTRQRPIGYVDSSQIDLSGDEISHGQPIRNLRNSRKRQLLSAPMLRNTIRAARSHTSPPDLQSSSQGSSSEAAEDNTRRSKRRSLRTVQSKSFRHLNYDDTVPEDDFDDILGSDESLPHLGKRKRSRDLGRLVTRKSDRNGRKLISMRERGEDDISEGESRSHIVKVFGAKESFERLPTSNDFRLRHSQNCDSCTGHGNSTEKGQLIFCQGCTLSYHQNCLGPRASREHLVTKVGAGNFVLQCRRCVEFIRKKDVTAPRQGQCQICREHGPSCVPFQDRKTSREEQKEREDNSGEDPIVAVPAELINNAVNVLFRCVGCYRAFHMHHLPKRDDNGIIGAASDEENAIERFSEYCRDWSCINCISAPAKIEALIAWRPTDEESYVLGTPTAQVIEDEKEYLIKWKDFSYYRATWQPGAWVWGVTQSAMRRAFERRDNGTNLPKMRFEDAIPEEYLRVDIVFDVKYTNVVSTRLQEVDKARVKEVASALVKFKGLGYEDVVWEDPPDTEDSERWEDFRVAYDDWVMGRYTHPPVQHHLNQHFQKIQSKNFESKLMLKAQPETLTGGKLMDYQLEGMNWLLYQWHRRQNAILADEMGLGKTIQVIAFLTTLQQKHKCWPFLIVVPDATCANWRREIKQWAPSLRVVMYFGSLKARELAHKYEMFPEGAKDLRCHVVVTSYNAAQDESLQKVFRRIPWQGLIVDEGQRLKNEDSLLYVALSKLKIPFRALLTGTPLQNNQRELFNLLQFLDNSIDAQTLEERYATLTKENLLEMHELLRPFFLRRTKMQVLTFLPTMAQIILPVTLSALQKKLYKSILAKNSDLLKAIFGGNNRAVRVAGLRNILMQLRKCLCHPFVYNIDIEEKSSNAAISHQGLAEASSKLRLLEIMLPKLKERGHRVLMFSQFLDMLTITEDFLDGLDLSHERIDGSMGSLEKQKRIDAFNAPDSPLFACLLSTRAGGVGINLATADTVIILDPDFNPHQDIQALSRAHRIGQKKKVLVFQMMTRGTAEEKIMQIGKKKMALDHVLIEQMDSTEPDGNDLESVLRFGAEALFKDDDTHDIHYDSASVDKLLDRTQAESTRADLDNTAESQFSFARVWANDKATMEDNLGNSSEDERVPDSTVWERILAERARQAALEAAVHEETLGRGRRQRQAINYSKQTANGVDMESPSKEKDNSDSDTDFQVRGEDTDDEETPMKPKEPVTMNELKSPIEGHPPRSQPIEQLSPLQNKDPFRRVEVRQHTMNAPPPAQLPCLACHDGHGPHPVGCCPLKIAGVERCKLCGLAHYGVGRTCPHLNSEKACRTMLKNLKDSLEPRELKDAAAKYLRGVIGDLVRKKKHRQEAAALAERTANGPQPLPIGYGPNGQMNNDPFGYPPPPIHPDATTSYAQPNPSSNHGPITGNSLPNHTAQAPAPAPREFL